MFGLGHTSTEGFSQQSCMDYSNDKSSISPNQHDHDLLADMYDHWDSYDSYDGGVVEWWSLVVKRVTPHRAKVVTRKTRAQVWVPTDRRQWVCACTGASMKKSGWHRVPMAASGFIMSAWYPMRFVSSGNRRNSPIRSGKTPG